MTKEEFRKFVLAEAKKYLKETKAKEAAPAAEIAKPKAKVNESVNKEEEITPAQIAKLAEEIKKFNMSFDFRNPATLSEGVSVDTVISESKEAKIEAPKEKSIFVDHKSKWKNLLEYKIPSDDERKNFK
jgi:hypothetical protein